MISCAAAKDGGEIARLRREAYIQAHIDHPNVARGHDLDQMPDGSMYVVMERLHGRSLADKLSREQVIAPGFALPATWIVHTVGPVWHGGDRGEPALLAE